MKESKTYGLLLKKTFLANDDAMLIFFTPNHGKISIFVPKFARSKKKAAEIDFFRILELEIFEGRNSYRLKSVFVKKVFRGFEACFEQTETGFLYLKILDEILQEEHPEQNLFLNLLKIFESIGKDKFLETFFWIKIFCVMGIFPRCDYFRASVWIETEKTIQILPKITEAQKKEPGIFFLPHEARQVLEFLRRSDFENFWLKKEKLPPTAYTILSPIIKSIARYHLKNHK